MNANDTRLLLAATALVAGCAAGPDAEADAPPPQADVPVAEAPYERIYVQFKETLDEQYVYVDHVGPFNDLTGTVQRLHAAVVRRGIDPVGPLFVQYLDDPRGDPTRSGRAQVCLPVAEPVAGDDELRFATSGPRTVVYTRLAGPFGSGRAAYPALDEHMRQWGWVQHGPIREVFSPVAAEGGFTTEIQVPWTPGR